MSRRFISTVQSTFCTLISVFFVGCFSKVALFGKPSELRCYVNDSRLPQFITWTKDSSQIFASEYNEKFLSYNITSTTYEQAGEYKCQLVYRSGLTNEYRILLQVYDYPEYHGNISTSMENETVFVTCCVKYSPSSITPILTWLIGSDTFTPTTEYREYKEKSPNSEANSVCNTITFQNGRKYHGKKLVCLVEDDLSVNASMELNVTYSPSVKLLKIASSDKAYPDDLWENETVAIECQADGNPSPLITLERKAMNRLGWQMCFYTVVTSINNNKYIWKFILPNITRNESGEYRCKATNGVGQYSVSKPGYLDVKYPPTVTMLTKSTVNIEWGGNFTVVCETDSNPSPEVTLYTTIQGHWVELASQSQKHEMTIYLSSWRFEFRNVSEELNGQYRCEASNGREKVVMSDVISVNVQRIERCLSVHGQETVALNKSTEEISSGRQSFLLHCFLIVVTILFVALLLFTVIKTSKDYLMGKYALKILPYPNRRNRMQNYAQVFRFYKSASQEAAQKTVPVVGSSSRSNGGEGDDTIIYDIPDKHFEEIDNNVIENPPRDGTEGDPVDERSEGEPTYLSITEAQVHEPNEVDRILQI